MSQWRRYTARKKRRETTLEIDLDPLNGLPSTIEFYIVPSIQLIEKLIETPNGYTVAAEDLRQGDRVLMEDGNTGTITFSATQWYNPKSIPLTNGSQGHRRVLGKSKRWVDQLLVLTTEQGVVQTTPLHLFYVNGKWIHAQDIKVGDRMWNRCGTGHPGTLFIDSISRILRLACQR